MTNETADLIAQHISPVFVATVLDQGDILKVAYDSGYAHVVGVTTAKDDADGCRERFKGIERIRIFHGEDIVLHEVIKDINVAVTFCLDSRSEPAPALIQELSILKHHRIKSHCIIVQNLSLLGLKESGFISFDQVRNAVRLVNDGYKFVKIGDNLLCTYP
jgi:hypothetical protein